MSNLLRTDDGEGRPTAEDKTRRQQARSRTALGPPKLQAGCGCPALPFLAVAWDHRKLPGIWDPEAPSPLTLLPLTGCCPVPPLGTLLWLPSVRGYTIVITEHLLMAGAGTKPRTNDSSWLLPVAWSSRFHVRDLRNSMHRAGAGGTVALDHWTTFTTAEPTTGKGGSHSVRRRVTQ